MALVPYGEKCAIPVLDRAARVQLDDGVKRAMPVAAHTLRAGDTGGEQMKQVRKDLDEVREENRSLRERLSELEARFK